MEHVAKFSDHKKEPTRKWHVLLSYCNTGRWGHHCDGGGVSPEMFAWWLHLGNQVKYGLGKWNINSIRGELKIISFVLLTLDKTVILEVSRMGTINLALWPDVYCIIFQLLEVLSRLKAYFFYAMDAWPPQCRFWNRGSIYIRNYSGKNEFESDFRALWYASFSVTCKVTKMWVT